MFCLPVISGNNKYLAGRISIQRYNPYGKWTFFLVDSLSVISVLHSHWVCESVSCLCWTMMNRTSFVFHISPSCHLDSTSWPSRISPQENSLALVLNTATGKPIPTLLVRLHFRCQVICLSLFCHMGAGCVCSGRFPMHGS